MDELMYSAAYSLRTCLALYESKFNSYVSKYPKSEEELEEESKYVQILQSVLSEINRYSKYTFDNDSFVIVYRISALVSQICNIHLPMSSKIYKLLIKINEKINNRS